MVFPLTAPLLTIIFKFQEKILKIWGSRIGSDDLPHFVCEEHFQLIKWVETFDKFRRHLGQSYWVRRRLSSKSLSSTHNLKSLKRISHRFFPEEGACAATWELPGLFSGSICPSWCTTKAAYFRWEGMFQPSEILLNRWLISSPVSFQISKIWINFNHPQSYQCVLPLLKLLPQTSAFAFLPSVTCRKGFESETNFNF